MSDHKIFFWVRRNARSDPPPRLAGRGVLDTRLLPVSAVCLPVLVFLSRFSWVWLFLTPLYYTRPRASELKPSPDPLGTFFRLFSALSPLLSSPSLLSPFLPPFLPSFIDFTSQNPPQNGPKTVPETVQKSIQKMTSFLNRFFTFFLLIFGTKNQEQRDQKFDAKAPDLKKSNIHFVLENTIRNQLFNQTRGNGKVNETSRNTSKKHFKTSFDF